MMLSSRLSAAALSLLMPLAVQAVNVSFTNVNYPVAPAALPYGQPFTLTWTGGQNSVFIGLAQGPKTNLQEVTALTSSYISGTSFTWTPPSSLPAGSYVFTITEADNLFENFSPYVCIGSCTSSTSSPPATASSSLLLGELVTDPYPAASFSASFYAQIVDVPVTTPYPTLTASSGTFGSGSGSGVGRFAAAGNGSVVSYNGHNGTGGNGSVVVFTGGAAETKVVCGAVAAAVLGMGMMWL